MAEPSRTNVECPLCGTEFDPTCAGGWCPDPACGEWKYEGEAVPDPESPEPAEEGDDSAAHAGAGGDERGDDEAGEDEAGDDGSEADDGPTGPGACPACGADVDPADNFCASCGEDLDGHREESDGGAATLVLRARGHEVTVGDGDTVGREFRRIVTETGGDEARAVSIHREHVRFVRADGTFHVEDLGENPTALNEEPLEQGDRRPVGDGDTIELSNVVAADVESR
jgi:hypothetical protein